jgi:hypothetical protein
MAQFQLKEEVFRAKAPFHAKHATTVVVDCADGRFTRSDDEFFEAMFKTTSVDELELPGGTATMHTLSAASWAEVEVMRAKLALLVTGHESKRIVLMSHHGCLHYKLKYAGRDADAIMQRQLDDLSEVAEELRRRFPKVEVRAFYKTISDDQHVVFHEVTV